MYFKDLYMKLQISQPSLMNKTSYRSKMLSDLLCKCIRPKES